MDVETTMYTQYKADVVNTATPEQLTLMLYEAALTSVRQTKEAISQGLLTGLSASQLARDILSALGDDVNVSHPHGQTMKQLYLFCWRTLIEACSKGDPSRLIAVETVLENLITGLKNYRAVATHTGKLEPEYINLDFTG